MAPGEFFWARFYLPRFDTSIQKTNEHPPAIAHAYTPTSAQALAAPLKYPRLPLSLALAGPEC